MREAVEFSDDTQLSALQAPPSFFGDESGSQQRGGSVVVDGRLPTAQELKTLIVSSKSHAVLANVFILHGTPFAFRGSPLKYAMYREHLAHQFDVASHDVCIVGSAKLGYSARLQSWGRPFSVQPIVEIAIISEESFLEGTQQPLFVLDNLGPQLRETPDFPFVCQGLDSPEPVVELDDWRWAKRVVHNTVSGSFDAGLLPREHPVRLGIDRKLRESTGTFLSLEPPVFVSEVRCRILRDWIAAERYYERKLRRARNYFLRFAITVEQPDKKCE